MKILTISFKEIQISISKIQKQMLKKSIRKWRTFRKYIFIVT